MGSSRPEPEGGPAIDEGGRDRLRFVLVHGGYHGAWCWELLVTELEGMGHEAVAVDLPGHGERASERATTEGYRAAVNAVRQPGDVLVGHSMGGNVITMAAADRPDVGHLVYLAAQVPVEGRPMNWDSNGGRPGIDRSHLLYRFVADNDDGTRMEVVDRDGIRTVFYHDVPDELSRWAASRLTAQWIDVTTAEPVHAGGFWDLDLPRSYIICTDDRALRRQFTERQADRLGVEAILFESSHSPFLSRPRQFAATLMLALDRRPVRPPNPDLIG